MLSFLGIGAQKCGTTWLYELLALHPMVRFPAGKEVHYWDSHRERGIDWYVGLFSGQAESAAVGEITPAYAILPPHVVEEIARTFPNLKLIYLLRNPIDRAWSSALMAMQRAELQIDEVSDQWFIDHFESRGSRARGDYETCIRNWRAVFPSDRLELIPYEEIRTRPFDIYLRCCAHLGVELHDTPQIRAQARQIVFAGPGHPIRPTLRRYLEGRYRARVESLSSYLEMDLSMWLST
jgi:sulfotransferase family protein